MLTLILNSRGQNLGLKRAFISGCVALMLVPGFWAQAQDSRLADLPQLIKQLDAKNVDQRVEAAKAIGELGPQAIGAAPALLERLDDMSITSDGDRVAPFYSQALAKLGPEVVPELVKQLDTDETFRLAGVCEALHLLGPQSKPAVDVIVRQLPEVGGNKLWGFIYVLEGIGPAAEPAVPHLIEELDSSDFQLQIVTCRALAAIGPAAKPATDKLLVLLKEGASSVRGHSALALANIGPQPDVDVAMHLVEALDYQQYAVRERVLEALGRLGPEAKSALPKLDEHFENKRFNAQVDLALAYFRISGNADKSLARLSEIASDFQNELEAIVAMGKMGPAAAPAIPMLLKKLNSEDPDIVYESCFTLAAIGQPSKEILARLDELAGSEDEFVASGAKQASQKLRSIKSPPQSSRD